MVGSAEGSTAVADSEVVAVLNIRITLVHMFAQLEPLVSETSREPQHMRQVLTLS